MLSEIDVGHIDDLGLTRLGPNARNHLGEESECAARALEVGYRSNPLIQHAY
jgi:hypothetical protein